MSLQEKIKAREKTKIVTILGEKVRVPRLPSAKKRRWQEEFTALAEDEQAQAEKFCELFRDPETDEPVFTPEFVLEEMADEDTIICIKAAFSIDFGEIEKN